MGNALRLPVVPSVVVLFCVMDASESALTSRLKNTFDFELSLGDSGSVRKSSVQIVPESICGLSCDSPVFEF